MDWNQFMADLQPTITNFVIGVLGLIAIWIGRSFSKFMNKKNELMETQLTDIQRAFVQKLAAEAVAFAAQTFKEYNGEEKLVEALNKLDIELNKFGIDLDEQSIRGIINKAYLEYKKNLKPINTETIIKVPEK